MGAYSGALDNLKNDCASALKFLSSFLGTIQRIISPNVRLISVTQIIAEN